MDFKDEMVAKMPAGQLLNARVAHPLRDNRPEFRIEITAADGSMLLVMREEDGRLVVEGDESRWNDAAMRFLQQMREWSGQVGLRWQNEVQKGAGSQ